MRWEPWMAYDKRVIGATYTERKAFDAAMGRGNFCKIVFYGYARWPSYCEWIVPGTVTDIERAE